MTLAETASYVICASMSYLNSGTHESKHQKGHSVPPVRFWTTNDFVVFLFLDTFRIQKCLDFYSVYFAVKNPMD